MQPYIFPYIGYYQLVQAVDHFVFYDDVQFIRRGWINRNAILVNGDRHTFSIPMKKQQRDTLIMDAEMSDDYSKWMNKFLNTVSLNYKKAPYFTPALELISDVLSYPGKGISAMAAQSIQAVAKYVGCKTNFSFSSSQEYNRELAGEDKILTLCHKYAATEYVNLPGGRSLYSPQSFADENVALGFIEPTRLEYKQQKEPFIPYLSIIDALMFNSPDELQALLHQFNINFESPNHGKQESNHLRRQPTGQPGSFLS